MRTLLELGSGGGNNASHLKGDFALTLVDRAPAMLAVSERLNPECEHVEGDMRSVRLDRTFDGVLIHDAVMYLTDAAALVEAFETAFLHLRPGGALVVAPDCVRETFEPGTEHGGHDGPDGRALRYLEWSHDPDPGGSTYRVDYAYLLCEADGTVRALHDRHVNGLFARAEWLDLLASAGFEASAVRDPWGRDVFAARRPA